MNFLRDLRYGARRLLRSPGFTLVGVLTLALGIGSNVAIFSVVRAVLLPDLPYGDPARLVQINTRNVKTGAIEPIAYVRDLGDWRGQNRTLENLAFFHFAMLSSYDGNQPEVLWGQGASANLLPTLGVPPMLGRYFTPEEDVPGGEHVIVLSFDVWQRLYGGDRAIVGKIIRLEGAAPPLGAWWA